MTVLLEGTLEVSWATLLLKVTKTTLAMVLISQVFNTSGDEGLRASGFLFQCQITHLAEMVFSLVAF